MLIKATTLKIFNAAVALGNLSLFGYVFNDMQSLVTFIYFNSAIIVASSFFDFGLNAVNSSVSLKEASFYVPRKMEIFFNLWLDRLIILICTPILGLIFINNPVITIGILLCVNLRIFLMRWITMERKDISVITSIAKAEIPLNIVNCFTLYLIVVSPIYFIIGQFLGNLLILYSLKNTRNFQLLWEFEMTRTFSITNVHNLNVILQSYLSSFKNNITGVLLGNVSGSIGDTIFIANRLGQIFLVGYSGLLASIPRLLRLNKQKLGSKWIIISMPPLFLLVLILLLPGWASYLINTIYNADIMTHNSLLLLIFLNPVLFSFLNTYLIAKNRQWLNIALDVVQISTIIIGVKCVVL